MNQDIPDIIIIEDNPYDAEITADALRMQNSVIRIRVLKDGEEALQYIHNCTDHHGPRPGLILLDLKLPKLNGLDVLRELRSHRVSEDIPVIVFTSSSEESDRIESYRLGANGYVVKPVSFGAFMEAIAEIYSSWMKMLP